MTHRKREVGFVDTGEYAKRGEWGVEPRDRASTARLLDLQNLPIDPAEVASQEHNEALKMRAAGASAVPAPKWRQ